MRGDNLQNWQNRDWNRAHINGTLGPGDREA